MQFFVQCHLLHEQSTANNSHPDQHIAIQILQIHSSCYSFTAAKNLTAIAPMFTKFWPKNIFSQFQKIYEKLSRNNTLIGHSRFVLLLDFVTSIKMIHIHQNEIDHQVTMESLISTKYVSRALSKLLLCCHIHHRNHEILMLDNHFVMYFAAMWFWTDAFNNLRHNNCTKSISRFHA